MNETPLEFHFDFQSYLRTELTQRCRSNQAYSLRAFARDLEIEPSALSKILNGKRAITPEMKHRFGKKLKLTRDQMRSLSCERSETGAESYRTLTEDSFRFLSDWYHFAILELTKVEKFVSDAAWIARSLGITKAEAQAAIERLQRLGFLDVSAHGRYIDISGDVTTVGHEFTNIALRNLQRQVLQKALEALENVEFEKRDQSSMTMAVDSSKIPQARVMTKKFRRDLCALLESGEHRDSVYLLSLSLFPLTKISNKGLS